MPRAHVDGIVDPRDEDTANLLTEIGLPRPQARILAHLARAGETASPALERAVDLRQPELSLHVQRLRARGLLTMRPVASGGRGRPTHHYRLAHAWTGICDAIAQKEGSDKPALVERAKNALDE